MGLVVIVALICVAVAFHELGHFLAARALGFPVPMFAVGFGPGLELRFDRIDTVFRLGVVPFGGFVALPPAAGRGWRGIVVSLGGPVASIVVGYAAYAVALVWGGEPMLANLAALGKAVVLGLGSLLDGSGLHDVVGPVGIVREGVKYAVSGPTTILYFAIVNVCLGATNLLPFPPLDGWGVVAGWWMPKRVNALALHVGGIVLVLAMVAITFRDIWQ